MLPAILTVVLLCPAPAGPDLSTPEKAAKAFAEVYLPRLYEDGKLVQALDENDLVGRAHYTAAGWAQMQRVVSDNKRQRDRTKTLRWSFRVEGVDRSGSQAVARIKVTQRRNRYDYGTRKIKVVEQRITHLFTFQQAGGRWLVSAARRGCYACVSTGQCPYCRGTGKRLEKACRECRGKGSCGTCAGKKLLSEDLEGSFKNGVLADAVPSKYDPGDLSTPKQAGLAFLRLRGHKQVVLGAARRKHFEETLARWRPFFVPALVKTFERNLAKSRAEIDTRQEEWNRIARLGEVQPVDADRARVLIRYVLPASRGRPARTLKFRLELRRQSGRWLIEEVQTKCYSCKRTRICKYCSGSGKDRRGKAVCVSCRGTAACNPCQGAGWIESTIVP